MIVVRERPGSRLAEHTLGETPVVSGGIRTWTLVPRESANYPDERSLERSSGVARVAVDGRHGCPSASYFVMTGAASKSYIRYYPCRVTVCNACGVECLRGV